MDIMSRRRGRKLVAGLDQICEAIESNITPAIRMTLQMRSQQLKIYEEHMKKIFDMIKVIVQFIQGTVRSPCDNPWN